MAITGPSPAVKRDSSSSSTKTQSKGLSQKEQDIVELLKDDPAMRQVFLQKIMDNKDDDDDDEPTSSVGSSTKLGPCDYQDSQDPFDL